MKIKEKGRNDAGNDDTEGRCKDFEHIVRVLYHGRHNEAANGLYGDHRPHDPRVATQESLFLHRRRVFEVNGNVGNEDGGESHLHVTNPERGPTAFEDLFCSRPASRREGRKLWCACVL